MLLLTKTKAVLGLHAIKEKPVAINGKVEIRPASVYPTRTFRVRLTDSYQMMYLALTYDHRLLDGREAVVFLVKVSVAVPKSRTSADMTTRSRSTSKTLARCSWVEWTLRVPKLYKMRPCITPDTSKKISSVVHISCPAQHGQLDFDTHGFRDGTTGPRTRLGVVDGLPRELAQGCM